MTAPTKTTKTRISTKPTPTAAPLALRTVGRLTGASDDYSSYATDWAEIDGKDVFMASKIKKGDFFDLKVRLTKNGKPFWTMDPEELARERASE